MDASTSSLLAPVARAAIAQRLGPQSPPPGATAPERPAPIAGADGRYRVMLDIDESSRRVVATFVDPDTNEVIDQLPSKKMLSIAASIREMLGALVDTQA